MLTKKDKKGYGKYLPGIFTFFDLLVVNAVFGLSLMLYPELMDFERIRTVWVVVTTAYLPMLFWFYRKPHYHRAVSMDEFIKDAVVVVIVHLLLFTSLLTFLEIELPIREYLAFYGMMIVLVPLWWMLSRSIIKNMRKRGYNYMSVVIVGSGPLAQKLFREFHTNAGFGYKVKGVFSDNPYPDSPLEITGRISDLEDYIRDHGVDQIFYTISGTDGAKLTRVLKIADDNMIKFYYVPQIPRKVSRSFDLHTVGSVPVLSVRSNPLSSMLNRAIKRTFDILFSGTFLLFSPLVFIPVAIAIKLSSPGPVFFRQERTGYKGKTFKCMKFRTMKVNKDSDKVQATKGDSRVTRVGEILRHTSIDELPQFINVFLGDMSIVGPRPHMLKHTEEYTKLIDPYMVRHIVKPGITGWAQVNGYRGITDELWKMEGRVEYDVWYIENWSFLLDLRIIVRTVTNALGGEENAF